MPFKIFGGQQPDFNTVSRVRFKADFKAQGQDNLRMVIDALLDEWAPVQGARVPARFGLNFDVASLGIQTDTRIGWTTLDVTSKGGFKIRTKAAQETFSYGLDFKSKAGTGKLDLTSDSANCGLRFYWGDGATVDVRISDKAALPVTLTHVYEKAGEFRTMAEGKRVAAHLKCGGANIVRTVTVTGSAPVAPPVASAVAPAASTKATGPSCPAGWKLDTRSANKKTGAYTCTAKAGTALPATRTDCPGDLSYFENVKKGKMGCQP